MTWTPATKTIRRVLGALAAACALSAAAQTWPDRMSAAGQRPSEWRATRMKYQTLVNGQTFDIERLQTEAGTEVELAEVLAVSNGNEIKIGKPYVEGAKVVLTVVDDAKRGEKVVSFKKRRRKGYERKIGHRQELTTVTVKSIA